MNRYARTRKNEKLMWIVYIAAGRVEGNKNPRLCHLVITIYQKTRRYDEDNVHGACKGLIDCLRKLGYIYHDSLDWLDLDIRQALDHKNPRIEIEIEDLA
jgi:Holliday junction resolvase RusA-like endonuclease